MRTNKKGVDIVKKQDIFVSLVMVVDDEEDEVDQVVKDAWKMLSSLYLNYEVIIVSNGFSMMELEKVTKLLEDLPCLRVIRLSYKARYDTALFAGLESAIGEYVVTLNPQFDDMDAVAGIVEQNQVHDIVQGVSETPVAGLFGSQLGRKLFYWYNQKYIGVKIPLNATYFAAYSRRAINAITSTKRSVRHIRHVARLVGYRLAEYSYMPKGNASSHRTLRTGMLEAIEIATAYSTHPLRFVTWLGVFAGVANVMYALYVVLLNLSNIEVAQGWTTTSLQLSGMFFLLFLILVVLAEYIGRILTESRKDPSYFVADELTSTISVADAKRRNITE